jgi:hypothetical protein
MIPPSWESFKGDHFEVGRQLGRFWVKRLNACSKTDYGRYLLKTEKRLGDRGWLGDAQRSKDYACLVSTLHREFPFLVEEIDGMVQGARDEGYKAFFETVFCECLGESDFSCSTIAYRGADEMILAHHEMEERRYPLCYAKVALEKKCGIQKFLTVSYPFQFFGSSVGANGTLAFTGNSIGMRGQRQQEVTCSLDGRVPKAVFTRLMLEQPYRIKRLLHRYHAVLPCHWYIATKGKIVSVQVRPLPSVRHRAAKQVTMLPVQETSCHTNHFQKGPCTFWSWPDADDNKDSRKRLRELVGIVGKLNDDSDRDARNSLKHGLEKVRKKPYTCATIFVRVGQSGTTLEAFDHFDGGTKGVGQAAIRV